MERDALDAWEAARQHGETVVLAAPTNETVARLNHAAQQRRLAAGELDTRGRTVVAGGYRFHVGDEIATRRNHRQLHTDQGLMIRNRDQWVIDIVHRNGDLTVHGRSGRVRLPADYVQAHVELAYAQTSHATQGRTVDRSILVLDGPTDVRGLYVPMTRGRHHNDAYIATTGDDTAVEVFADVDHPQLDRPTRPRPPSRTRRPEPSPPRHPARGRAPGAVRPAGPTHRHPRPAPPTTSTSSHVTTSGPATTSTAKKQLNRRLPGCRPPGIAAPAAHTAQGAGTHRRYLGRTTGIFRQVGVVRAIVGSPGILAYYEKESIQAE